MNNQNSGTSKRIERYDYYAGYDGAWLSSAKTWVVQIGSATNKRYRCINVDTINVGVNCGNHFSN